MGRTVNFKGTPLRLEGPEIKVGDKAPGAVLRKDLVTDFDLSEAAGRARVYSVVPSLDTPVCALQTKRFNAEAPKLSGVDLYTISCDLPVAMARFCGAEGIDPERHHALSDHKDVAFGKAYGTLLPDLRIQCRAVFVIDSKDIVRHVEYVSEITEEPDYGAVLACVKNL